MQSCVKSGYENENTNKERQAMPLLKKMTLTLLALICLVEGLSACAYLVKYLCKKYFVQKNFVEAGAYCNTRYSSCFIY